MKKSAYLEVGNACFCKCITCDIHSKPHKNIDFDKFLSRVDLLKKIGFNQIRLAGNDPLTHFRFCDMVEYLHNKNMTVDVTTTLLNKDKRFIDSVSQCDIIRISLSAVYDDYQKFFNVKKFDLLINNLMYIVEEYPLRFNKNNRLIFNYTFVKSNKLNNYSEVAAIKLISFLNNLDLLNIIELHFFPAIIYGKTYSQIEIDEINTFIEIMNKYEIPHIYTDGFNLKKMKTCKVQQHCLYIKVNGDIYPCCMAGGEIGQDKVSELLLGNIDTVLYNEFLSITNSSLKNLNNIICNNCTPKYYLLNK